MSRLSFARLRLVEMVSGPPSGIASRAFKARLRIAFSSWFSSHRALPVSSPSRVRTSISLPIECSSICFIVSITALTGTGAMRIRWSREKASSWVVSLAPRRPDSSAVSAIRLRRGSVTALTSSSRPPITGVRRLLKSWAMPPVSWPTASIFCAWRSASSARSRSATSASSLARGDLGLQPIEREAEVRGAPGDLLLQGLGAQFPFGDVVGGADEADMLALRPPARLRDRAQPAPLAVGAAEAALEHERFQRGLAGQRFGEDPGRILGMDDVAPIIVDRLLVGDAHEVDIGAVDEVAPAVELGYPHRYRRGVGDQPEALLALAGGVLGGGVVADRGDRSEHAADLAVLAEDRVVAEGQPDRLLDAVAAKRARLVFEEQGLAGERALGIGSDPLPMVGPDLAHRLAVSGAAVAEDLAIAVIVEQQQVGPPGEEHRHGRGQDDGHP